ncbi:MAG TPA: hypothetical protein VHL14_13640 [Steroidobacteraceae bacterium]|jgi:hypothetical protein|nr:hypothetical protein [Steroidobacteraceae bacterium]
MANSALCWKCGASLAQLTLPILRLDACKQCGSELHVCKQCQFYDVAVAKHCRETVAEEVRDKQRANFCDYFVLNEQAYKPQPAANNSINALNELFGGSTSSTSKNNSDQARNALDDLFKK